MPPEKQLFEVLDNYARTYHRCFLAEMFLDKSGAEYVLCFRPLSAKTDSSHRYSCRYLRIGLADATRETGMKALGTELRLTLDDELRSLNESDG